MKVRITLEADVEKYPAYDDPNDGECKSNFYHLLYNAIYQINQMKQMEINRHQGAFLAGQEKLIYDTMIANYEQDRNLLTDLLNSIKIEAI